MVKLTVPSLREVATLRRKDLLDKGLGRPVRRLSDVGGPGSGRARHRGTITAPRGSACPRGSTPSLPRALTCLSPQAARSEERHPDPRHLGFTDDGRFGATSCGERRAVQGIVEGRCFRTRFMPGVRRHFPVSCSRRAIPTFCCAFPSRTTDRGQRASHRVTMENWPHAEPQESSVRAWAWIAMCLTRFVTLGRLAHSRGVRRLDVPGRTATGVTKVTGLESLRVRLGVPAAGTKCRRGWYRLAIAMIQWAAFRNSRCLRRGAFSRRSRDGRQRCRRRHARDHAPLRGWWPAEPVAAIEGAVPNSQSVAVLDHVSLRVTERAHVQRRRVSQRLGVARRSKGRMRSPARTWLMNQTLKRLHRRYAQRATLPLGFAQARGVWPAVASTGSALNLGAMRSAASSLRVPGDRVRNGAGDR